MDEPLKRRRPPRQAAPDKIDFSTCAQIKVTDPCGDPGKVVLPHPRVVGSFYEIDAERLPLLVQGWAAELREISTRREVRERLHNVLYGLNARRLDVVAAQLTALAESVRAQR